MPRKDLSVTLEPGQFVTLVGPSGCGKSTLLRHMKTVLTPTACERVKSSLRSPESLDQRVQSMKIGFVQQSPDNQIVTDKVWHELAFGLERVWAMTPPPSGDVWRNGHFFGIQTWFYKVTELSGGQKQLLNLASIMAMQPSVLNSGRAYQSAGPHRRFGLSGYRGED